MSRWSLGSGRDFVRVMLAVAVAVAVAACGGGGSSGVTCPTGFTGSLDPPAGDRLAVCSVNGIAQAYDIQDYPAAVAATGAVGSSDYELSVTTPGFVLPSPQVLTAAMSPGTNDIGGYNVYVVDKLQTVGNVSTLHRVYSFLRTPRALAAGAVPVPLVMSYVDYGMWEAGRIDATIPSLLAYYRGPWSLPKDGVLLGAPTTGSTYGGYVFVNHVDRNIGTFASRLVTGFTFNLGESRLSGVVQSVTYDPAVPLPSQPLPALTLTSTSVDPDDGAVIGKITGPVVGFGDPPEIGRFEGYFAGPDGEEFVARIAVYLSAPSANPPVRAVGFIALKKQP